MRFRFLQTVVAGLILSVYNIANAGLIDMGDYIYDDSANIERLKLDSTFGCSYNEVSDFIATGHLNDW